ncbi:MAG: hypothetical protein CL458_01135 [Acidimicrobiaceae bacterium]|nr:hypothetical protein [Acidimicrobiaceae bacterium]|tara:strand:- start:140 stop:502 length:363 start_codon:yes stop_codon:yes gene_type:complete
MTSRRRRRAASVVVISWRNIPAQVVGTEGHKREVEVLSERFQHAIDRAAGVAGVTETDAYIKQWVRDEQLPEPDLAGQVKRIAASLEADYDSQALEQLVRNGGFHATNKGSGDDGRYLVN